MTSEDPVWQELTPLFAAVHTLPPATRHQLLQLWQAALTLVHGGRVSPPRPPGDQASDACAVDDAMTPYY